MNEETLYRILSIVVPLGTGVAIAFALAYWFRVAVRWTIAEFIKAWRAP